MSDKPDVSVFTEIGVEQEVPHLDIVFRATCTKIMFHGYDISMAFDNSCGGMGRRLGRSYLKVFLGEKDVTSKFSPDHVGEMCAFTSHDLFDVMKKIESRTKRA